NFKKPMEMRWHDYKAEYHEMIAISIITNVSNEDIAARLAVEHRQEVDDRGRNKETCVMYERESAPTPHLSSPTVIL
ncbi:MAG: hypothetical protein WEB37_13445, partial [Bacteroidota bacterium]